jgi:hypothetical protein
MATDARFASGQMLISVGSNHFAEVHARLTNAFSSEKSRRGCERRSSVCVSGRREPENVRSASALADMLA